MISQHSLSMESKRCQKTSPKLAYAVPLMAQIRGIPKNGFTVASTFAGGGGSSTGYEMAGFTVKWANEFVPAACDTYAVNHPQTILNKTDVRRLIAEDILKEAGLKAGELDIFDGSPPCQAFSTAGQRSKGWAKEKEYEHGAKQKNQDLIFEFARLLAGLKPKVFVMENVSGLLKGVCKGYFIDILGRLKACGYQVECRLLDAQWLGVPQTRQRAIFVGVRNDLCKQFNVGPIFPKPLKHRYSVGDACPWIVKMERGKLGFGAKKIGVHKSAPSVLASIQSPWSKCVVNAQNESKERKLTITEVKRICSFPDDYTLTGSYRQQWERLGNAVPPVMMFHIASAIRDGILKLCSNGLL